MNNAFCRRINNECLIKIAVILLFTVLSSLVEAQKIWDGGGAPGKWDDPLNWVDDIVPGSGETVTLDNSVVQGSYMVWFPAGSYSATLMSLRIQPDVGSTIDFQLPKENISAPALTLSGTGLSLIIAAGGKFTNASGASSGSSIVLADSLCIFNEGRYVHQTPRSHVALVDKLSQRPGTEGGLFEFNVPTASSTVSLSDRTYGTLVLSAVAAGGSVSYTASGTRRINIRGDLMVNVGVRFNLNCSDTLFIRGQILANGLLNLSSNARKLITQVRGHVTIGSFGSISETGTSGAELFLQGDAARTIDFSGPVANDVELVINASAPVIAARTLRLDYKLKLVKGVLKIPDTSKLVLTRTCVTIFDSTSSASFIEGIIRKEDVQLGEAVVFPVGSGLAIHWLRLANISGDVEVRYMKSNPRLLSESFEDVHHISSLEYWIISALENAAGEPVVQLSFPDGNHSGVTDMATLLVAKLIEDKWVSAGNTATSGSAGGNGSVQSNPISEFTPGRSLYVTLASTTGNQNPLPLGLQWQARRIGSLVEFSWTNPTTLVEGSYFMLQTNYVGGEFKTIETIAASEAVKTYLHRVHISSRSTYYRLVLVMPGRTPVSSRVIHLDDSLNPLVNIKPVTGVQNELSLWIESSSEELVDLRILDLSGRIILKTQLLVLPGNHKYTLPVTFRSRGMHVLQFKTAEYQKVISVIR